MATTYKSTYKRFNGTDWDTHYFKTSADVIVETASYKVMTASERTAISTYLTTFNDADKLLKLDGSGLIPEALIPGGLEYLPITGGTMAGSINMGGYNVNNVPSVSAGAATLAFSGQNGITFASDGDFTFTSSTGKINANSLKISNLGTPVANTDAATKLYVDNLITAGLNVASAPVLVSTTGPITLSGTQTIDGVAVVVGNRVLVKNQATASDNGIYTVAAAAWSKVAADSEQGTLVFVQEGSTYNDWLFVNTNGTTWVEFSKPDTIVAGSGLTRSGNTISISNLGVTAGMLAGSIGWEKLNTTAIADNASITYDTWAKVTNADTGKSLAQHTSMLAAAIGLLRGTPRYNTSNTETVAGAYDLAEVKNRSYVGASDPLTTGYVSGDMYFQTIA